MSEETKKTKVPAKLKTRNLFGFKLKQPTGIYLDTDETKQVIDLWKEDSKQIDTNTDKLESANRAIAVNVSKIPEILKNVGSSRSEAIRYFKASKDPIKKREWARRLIVADRSYQSIKQSEKRMEAVKARIQAVVHDAALEKMALDVRISEAEAYVKMGEGLTLVGDSLIAARQRAKSADVQFEVLEFNTEAIEGEVNALKDKALIEEAQKVIG